MSTHEVPKIKSLKFEQVSFHYENSPIIFEDVNFDFPTDKFVWVRSLHSGSGRSTLLQILAGLAPLSSGQYKINGENISEMSFEEFLPYRLAIGYSFDFGGLLHNQTLLENLKLPLMYHKICSHSEAVKKVTHYMEALDILKYKDLRPSNVQTSVRKIAALIRPLLLNPQLLLLDDPSLGVEQEIVLKYLDIIQELRKKGTCQHVFISTFDEKLMGLIEHQEVLINNSQLVAEEIGKKVVNL